MNFQISSLVNAFEESATLALSGKAKKMAAEGRSVINFGVGEPDFNTPEGVIEAAFKGARAGKTKYTPVGGVPSLRRAVCERMSEDYGVKFDSPDEVVISSGGKQAIYHFLQAVINPGDEVIIISPYWVSFPEMVKMVGGRPVIVHPKGDRLDPKELEAQIGSKTRVLILNSPSNPTGQVYDSDELRSFLKVITPHPIWLLSDDTYYTLVYEPATWTSALRLLPDFRSRTCLIGSCSKTYAMTGWRLGWALAPKPLADAMIKLQGQVTSSASQISQVAAEAALKDFHGEAEGLRVKFQKRRDLIWALVQKIPGLKAIRPEGAFYLFVDFRGVLKGRSSVSFASELLEKEGVCMIPGDAFGAPGFGRLSYALSEAEIEEGLKRLQRALGV